jgi:hypothetical protein
VNEQQIKTAIPEAIPMTRVVWEELDSSKLQPKLATEWYPVLKIGEMEIGVSKDGRPVGFESYEKALAYAEAALRTLQGESGNGTQGEENSTIFRVDGEHAWGIVICPGREHVEEALEQNRIPPDDFSYIRAATRAELKRFCDAGYRPFFHQAPCDSGDLYQVYYATDKLDNQYRDPDRRFVVGETHKYIRAVHAKNVAEVYHLMQGHVWSPNGEARSFIAALEGVHHTSLSIGDVVISPAGWAWMCVSTGWEKVKRQGGDDDFFYLPCR